MKAIFKILKSIQHIMGKLEPLSISPIRNSKRVLPSPFSDP